MEWEDGGHAAQGRKGSRGGGLTAASMSDTLAVSLRFMISPVTPSIQARSQPRASSALRTAALRVGR